MKHAASFQNDPSSSVNVHSHMLFFMNFKMKIMAWELYCPFGSSQNRQMEMEKILNEKDQWRIQQIQQIGIRSD